MKRIKMGYINLISKKKHVPIPHTYVFNSQNVSMIKDLDFKINASLPIRILLVDGFTRNGIDEITTNYNFKHISVIILMFINPIHHFVFRYVSDPCACADKFKLFALNIILFKQALRCFTRRSFTFRNNPCMQESQCDKYQSHYRFEILAIGIKKNSRFEENLKKLINNITTTGIKRPYRPKFVNMNFDSDDFDIHSMIASASTEIKEMNQTLYYHRCQFKSFRPAYHHTTCKQTNHDHKCYATIFYHGIQSNGNKDFTDEYCFDNKDIQQTEFETTIEMRYNHVNKQLSFWKGDTTQKQILIGKSCKRINPSHCNQNAICFDKGFFTLSDEFEYYPVLCTIGCSCTGKHYVVSYTMQS